MNNVMWISDNFGVWSNFCDSFDRTFTPGNFKLARDIQLEKYHAKFEDYYLIFDSEKDKTMFLLRWS